MPTAKSFIEVLEEQIRQDLRAEVEAEVRAEFTKSQGPAAKTSPTASSDLVGRFESILASRVGQTVFSKVGLGKQAYGTKPAPAPKAQPQPAAPTTEPSFTAKTVEQLCAIEMIKRHSDARLGTTFTFRELKSAWRKAALGTHPDRFAGADEITRMRATVTFRELVEAYELLSNSFGFEAAA